jgi:heat shock protein HslJ
MKIKHASIGLVLLLIIGITTVFSFSLGCAEQREPSPQVPAENNSSGGKIISAENISNIEWQWTGFQNSSSSENHTLVPKPENYTLAFFLDGTYYIRADCNQGSGNYTLKGSTLSLGPATMTLMGCGPGTMDSEYLALLSDEKSTSFENNQLVLYSGGTGVKMFFTNGGKAEK